MTIEKIQEFVGAPMTGIWDKITVEKVCEFQKQHKLSETGLPSRKLKEFIEELIARKTRSTKRKEQKIK